MLKINDMKWFDNHYHFYGFEDRAQAYTYRTVAIHRDSKTSNCDIFINKEDGAVSIYYTNYYEPIILLDELFELPDVLFDLIKAEKIEKEGE